MHRRVPVLLLIVSLAFFPLITPLAGSMPHWTSTLLTHWHWELAPTASEADEARTVEHGLMIVSALIEKTAAE